MKLEAFTNLLSHLKFENWPIISRVTSLLAEVAFVFLVGHRLSQKNVMFPAENVVPMQYLPATYFDV